MFPNGQTKKINIEFGFWFSTFSPWNLLKEGRIFSPSSIASLHLKVWMWKETKRVTRSFTSFPLRLLRKGSAAPVLEKCQKLSQEPTWTSVMSHWLAMDPSFGSKRLHLNYWKSLNKLFDTKLRINDMCICHLFNHSLSDAGTMSKLSCSALYSVTCNTFLSLARSTKKLTFL